MYVNVNAYRILLIYETYDMNVCTVLIRSYIQEHIIMNVSIPVCSHTLMFYFRSSESIEVMFLFPDRRVSLRKILCICFYSQH